MFWKNLLTFFRIYFGAFFYLYLIFNWSLIRADDDEDSNDDDIKTDPELPILISQILDNLTDIKQGYDKRLRPDYGGKPVDVGITLAVISISAISEVQMDYTLDIYLRQMWTDSRLAFRGRTAGTAANRDLTIGVKYMESIWVPDTFFPNEKSSYFHIATTHNSFLRITPDGEISTSQRITVTASCTMELQLFPLDLQRCILDIESYGYSTSDISYAWYKGKKSVEVTDNARKLPQFDLSNHDTTTVVEELSTGSYSRLKCIFIFTRSLGFYMIQIYLPAVLIVVISWVSFWLSREATPARVSLGVTTVLTMTTLMTTTNAAMPKVSYVKSIDIYLITCFFMVFSSLIEYAAVGYLNKKLRMFRERKKPKKSMPPPPTSGKPPGAVFSTGGGGLGGSPMPNRFPIHHPLGPNNANMGMNQDPRRAQMGMMGSNYGALGTQPPSLGLGGGYHSNQTNLLSPQGTTNALQLQQQQQLQLYQQMECDCDLECAPVQTNAPTKKIRIAQPKKGNYMGGVTPSGIDRYSRIMFPLFFGVFNAIYWSVYMYLKSLKASEFGVTS